MKGLIEYKDFSAEIKDVDTSGMKVSGWWASYGNKDFDNDIIEPGAASKTIAERGPAGINEIFFLNQHNWEKPHGRPSVLKEDERGIYFESKIAPTSYGKDAIILYSEGIVAQHSIGFVTLKSDRQGNWGDDDYVRRIKEIKLYEGSNVTLGANPNTPFTGFKSLTAAQCNDQITKILKLIRSGNLTDETFSQLEIALKQLQKHSFELGKKEALEAKPEPSTSKKYEPLAEQIKQFTNALKR